MLDTEALHETPEGIALGLRAAGAAPRALAWLVDAMIRIGVFTALAMPISILGEAGQGVLLILMFALMWVYPILFELLMDGQTPGKRVLGLRVVHANGTPVGFTASLIRNLMRTVDALPVGYAFGFASCVVDPQARRLGDLVAGTLVVHADRRRHDETIPAVPGYVPALSLPAEEQAVVVAFAERAAQLTEARQIELAGLLTALTQTRGSQAVQRLLGYANHIVGALMRQDQFIARHDADWIALATWLDQADRRKRDATAESSLRDSDVPQRYRRLCQQLALARKRGYSPMLIERLAQLVERTHTLMYRPPNPRWWRAIAFIASEFPAEVRAQWGWMLASGLLFFGPFFAMIAAVLWQPELAHSVFDVDQLAQMEQMYDPSNTERLGRDSGTDLMMFGHYIMNNISIGFRSFASGLLVGIGSVIVLVSNGVMIGTIAGHLTGIGYGAPFWRFVVGHSAPELLAIVISGGAGMRLGFSLIAPGQLTRVAALLAAGRIGARLILGVFVMLLAAAFIEAFWSSIASLPDVVKYGSGGAIWLFVLGWLGFGGRGRVRAS